MLVDIVRFNGCLSFKTEKSLVQNWGNRVGSRPNQRPVSRQGNPRGEALYARIGLDLAAGRSVEAIVGWVQGEYQRVPETRFALKKHRGLQVALVVPHIDDELYGAELLAAAMPAGVARYTSGEAGKDGTDPHPNPHALGERRRRDGEKSAQALGYDTHYFYPVDPERTLDSGFTTDPAEARRVWQSRGDPDNRHHGLARLVQLTDEWIRVQKPAVVARFSRLGDGHHGPASHGDHVVSAEVVQLAVLTASVDLGDPGRSNAYRVPAEVAFAPSHVKPDLVVEPRTGARARGIQPYVGNQFTTEEAKRFVAMPEGYLLEGSGEDEQRRIVSSILEQ